LPTAANAQGLWIQYFYSYLNDAGRAGFVMASSASDAGNKDRDIREKLVHAGHVDVMVAIGTKFFYTRSLNAIVWLYRGEAGKFVGLVHRYQRQAAEWLTRLPERLRADDAAVERVAALLRGFVKKVRLTELNKNQPKEARIARETLDAFKTFPASPCPRRRRNDHGCRIHPSAALGGAPLQDRAVALFSGIFMN
jgi:type I restriction enzyme M protein